MLNLLKLFLIQFLIESIVLTLSGGALGSAIGIFAGKGFAWVINEFVWPGSNWPAVISLQAVFLALSVSVGVGLFFGLYPANKASKLQPIEALRSD